MDPGFWEGDATGGPFLYFASSRPGLGGDDICASTPGPDGTWGPATLLVELSSPFTDQGPEITVRAEQAAALSRDGGPMIFLSNRPGGFGGSDLYITSRTKLRTGG